MAIKNWPNWFRVAKTKAQEWHDRVKNNHQPFRKDCSVCVRRAGSGRGHTGVVHPSQYTLSADVWPRCTKDIETVLSSLTPPLQVVHTVDPAEVALNPTPWIPSIEKEVGAVEHAVLRLRPSDPKQAEYLNNPRLQIVPSKLVFTVKPPDQGAAVVGDASKAASQSQGLYRRISRPVACGNAAPNTGLDVYAGGAQAESLRLVIALGSFFGWMLGCLDITSAFLKTPIPDLARLSLLRLPRACSSNLGLPFRMSCGFFPMLCTVCVKRRVCGVSSVAHAWLRWSGEFEGDTFRLEPSTLDPNWWKVIRTTCGKVEGALLV